MMDFKIKKNMALFHQVKFNQLDLSQRNQVKIQYCLQFKFDEKN